MTRIILISSFGLLLTACTTVGSGRIDLAQERLACADVGIGQSSPAFAQCVADLDGSLSQQQQLDR